MKFKIMNINNDNPIKVTNITKDDVLEVLYLSNQKSVRSNSFNSQEIKLESHKKWFRSKLQDKDVVMLKALIDGAFAGQVRLEIEKGVATIGISVSENYRRKGVGSVLIASAFAEAKKRKVKKIEAFIKPSNQGSINLFEKNGFVFKGVSKVSGSDALKYENSLAKE